MFCPHIKDECRPDCVKWVASEGKCLEMIMSEYYVKTSKMTKGYDYMFQMYHLAWSLEIKRLMDDPMIPDDIKEAIKEAKDASAAEKILRDAGLLY